ncbi:MAG: Ig-like domain-containing protein [Eubacterium sp.]|nr:Ig-like domain-containing protein [Eubacterium sp.]
MGKTTIKKRAISIILAMLMAVTGLLPAATAFAADGDGVEGYYDIELFYKDTDTIVPTSKQDGSAYIEYMVEGQELKLTYKLIDTEMPDNGYIKWFSETPTLVDVTQEGVVKAFDSSKGAVVQSWIDNEVKTIPLVGGVMASVIEKALFNDYVNVDTMDTEAIVEVVEGLFGSESALAQWVESYKGQLIDSLREYLDKINSNIHVQLCAEDGSVLADDYVQIAVTKNEEWYANFLPNGTHITNKSQINTTVAVGSTVQLYAVTTPVRLHYGVIYSVKSSSIFDRGKVVATVNDSGLVTFKNTGTVTVVVSPDTEDIIEGILKLVNYVYALDNTGTLDTDKIAGILIDYVGIDMNRTVLAALLDVCFAVKDIAGNTADPVQLTATAVEIISNLVLQFVYNDSITFNVVESKPLTDFSIDGANSVREGSQIQLSIVNIQPEVGNTSDITWTSSDPSIASVDPKTGVITGRDAGGSLGVLSSQKCTIYATSAANNITKSYVVTVTGRTGQYLSDVEIAGKDYLEMGEETDYTYSIYPKRVSNSSNLYVSWGIQNGVDEDGNPVYLWADDENSVTDGIGTIDSKGHYIPTNGGKCTIAVKATTGYYLSNKNFFEISSFIGTFNVTNGIPIDEIKITAVDGTSNGDLNRVETVIINGQEHTYVTIHKGIAEAYYNNGAIISASIYPSNASNQTLKWVVDNSYYNTSVSDDTHTATVKQAAGHEVADTFNIYAVSGDGKIKSNIITVCVTRNYAVSNTIDQSSIEIIRGRTADATHTIKFDGSWTSTAYACYKCNWYSSDDSIFTVETRRNDNRDATLTAVDVGTATLYCVSADGGIVDTCQVTVYPDKERLKNIVNLCDRTIVIRTEENKKLYNEYMKALDLAYFVLYDQPMASQMVCDTYADELLYAFYKVGGFVDVSGVNILGPNKTELASDHITVNVGTLQSYTDYSYDLEYEVTPSTAMYSDVEWTSSNSSIKVGKNGKCTPSSNDPGSAIITCTVTDYMGNKSSDSVFVTFARTAVTGVTLDIDRIIEGKVGENQKLTATVSPTGTIGIGAASRTDVYWSSSDESIAKVDQNGVVTFVAGGDCTIYCTTYDGGYVAQCAVNVVTNYSALELLIKQYTDLSLNPVNYYPDSWEAFEKTMQKAKDMVARRGYSQAEVDKMTAELEKAYKDLRKYNYLQNIELYLDGEQTKEFYQYDLSLFSEGISYKNAVLDLNVRLYPNNASYESVKWESSTTDISVTSDGKCSPTINDSCYGRITCIVTDHYGNSFRDSVWVSFAFTPVTSLALSETAITGAVGETFKLYCTVYPTGRLGNWGAASIQDYYWESDNLDVASVSQDGTVEFVSAGSTIVRAVSYDGGISAECVVSTEGDRSALREIIEKCKGVDYTQYTYEYGMAFKDAYENALRVMDDNTVSQQDIDNAAAALNKAYQDLLNNPYIKADYIDIAYTTYSKPLVGSAKSVTSGTVPSSDALSINLSKGYSNWNNYNYVTLVASPSPSNAMYKSFEWAVAGTSKMDTSISNTSITLTPTKTDEGAWAILTVTITDHYDRTYTRVVSVVMSDDTVTGFEITDTVSTMYATDAGKQLAYTVSGSGINTVIWSSSNEKVLKVNESGVITPVDKGTATITGKTFDGGYTDSITIEVLTDFSMLAEKQNEYYNLIEEATGTYLYTEESLNALAEVVAQAKTMITEGRATQAEVNQMIEELDNAYNSLVEYVVANGISIGYEEDSNVTLVREGFLRYANTISITGKTISLVPIVEPADSIYTSIKWESSNSNVTVDEFGLVKNTSLTSAVASKITCTITNLRGEMFTATMYVAFTRSGVTGISFNNEMVSGAPAETVKLSPNITNQNNSSLSTSYIKDCFYSSSDESIATVDDNGVVTFISQGEAIITATTLDGGYTATIKAFTTWDSTALKAAINTAKSINYMDYAYSYGTSFKAAYENAVAVYDNIYASQDEIDTACSLLTEAMTALEGNEFISPVVTILQNGEAVESGALIQADENGIAALDIALNEGAMVKSVDITTSNESGVTALLSDNTVLITKTAEKGSITVTVKTVDDYDREAVKTYDFSIIDEMIPATSIALTADGELVTDSIVRSCGGSYNNFKGLTIGYITTPENANCITSVSYTSSAPNSIKVSDSGVVEVASLGKLASSNTATITCTVTNADGTTASASVTVTITRA